MTTTVQRLASRRFDGLLTLGMAETNRLVKAERLPIWTWNTRWFLPQQQEEFSLELMPDGEVIGFSHTISETAPGAALDQPAEVVQRLHGLLAADERARADRFHFDRDRRRFIVAHGVLRSILGGYLKIAPEHLTFEYGAQGKPGLSSTHTSLLHFNVAHSHELAVYAFALNQAVGIDVEYALRHVQDADHVAQRFFSANEYQAYRAVAADEKRPAFFRCWTRKEAYIKAIGAGLSHALDRFEVTLAPDRPPAILSIDGDPLAGQRWSLMQLEPAADYVGALAIEGQAWQLARWQWASKLLGGGE